MTGMTPCDAGAQYEHDACQHGAVWRRFAARILAIAPSSHGQQYFDEYP